MLAESMATNHLKAASCPRVTATTRPVRTVLSIAAMGIAFPTVAVMAKLNAMMAVMSNSACVHKRRMCAPRFAPNLRFDCPSNARRPTATVPSPNVSKMPTVRPVRTVVA